MLNKRIGYLIRADCACDTSGIEHIIYILNRNGSTLHYNHSTIVVGIYILDKAHESIGQFVTVDIADYLLPHLRNLCLCKAIDSEVYCAHRVAVHDILEQFLANLEHSCGILFLGELEKQAVNIAYIILCSIGIESAIDKHLHRLVVLVAKSIGCSEGNLPVAAFGEHQVVFVTAHYAERLLIVNLCSCTRKGHHDGQRRKNAFS